MADILTFINQDRPASSENINSLQRVITLPSSGIANGDTVAFYMVPPGQRWRLNNAALRVAGSLGASATLQLRLNRGGSRTVLTGATTAGGASKVDSDAQAAVPIDVQGGDILEALVGGAGITASAAVTLDATYTVRPGL